MAQPYITPQELQRQFASKEASREAGDFFKLEALPGVPLSEIPLLAPDAQYQLSKDAPPPQPTAQAIVHNTFDKERDEWFNGKDIVFYLPRMAMFTGQPSLGIVFACNGKPGPHIKDILRDRKNEKKVVVIDGSEKPAFPMTSWSRIRMLIDWPGIERKSQSIKCTEGSGFYTRGEVAFQVAQRVTSMMYEYRTGANRCVQIINSETRRWDIRKVPFRRLRLLALNYYRNVWVPIIALDIPKEEQKLFFDDFFQFLIYRPTTRQDTYHGVSPVILSSVIKTIQVHRITIQDSGNSYLKVVRA
ncbi:hypothetical protein D9613_003457 [Agrocybe pediades]|uniref:Uncharacterized protein n=1 Tax=Agrocybe pediades TaxID=84607 RepID=A0A8H4QQG9_9AGAR|nr:hypothetical protein D9613_003457 [Agrocybe pediades]